MSESNDDQSSGCPVHGSSDSETSADDLLSYGSYLKVPELLSLQEPESDPPAHDELLFITIHQAYELWFKEILFEVDSARELLDEDDLHEGARLLERVVEIEDLLVDQIHILETMEPKDFLEFRSALKPASGFQSVQFRELELTMGVEREDVLEYVELDDEEAERIERRKSERSLRTVFYETLQRHDFDVAVPPSDGELDEADRERTLDALAELYRHPRDHYQLQRLGEALVDHDQKILTWRFHHVRVVERLIGNKTGTGGSPGVEYLRKTVGERAFPLLWEVRGELSDEEFYGVQTD